MRSHRAGSEADCCRCGILEVLLVVEELELAEKKKKKKARKHRKKDQGKEALMKLFIEVELGPDEISLATELFRTMRVLTEHVKTRDIGKLFQALISRLEDDSQLDRVAAEIATLLTENVPSETILDDFQTAFVAVVFSHDLVLRQQSVVPFMFLLPRLPEPAKSRMRDFLIPKVLKHLTLKRPVDASRMDFFAHAEAFAALVSLEFVSIIGAVTTIITLLRKPDTRCAAITMLGKTVELCLPQLNEKCDAKTMAELNAVLHTVTEDAFQYDINYIEESMNWSRPMLAGVVPKPEPPTAATMSSQGDSSKGSILDASPAPSGLHPAESYVGHRNPIFAMSYDDKRNQLISGAKDGTLIVWGPDGKVSETVDMASHYACSMDINSSHQMLLVCGVAKEDSSGQGGTRLLPPPCILRYGAAGHGWKEQGMLLKDSSKLVACIKAMGGMEHAFVTGETVRTSAPEGSAPRLDERVCYYDINAASFTNLQPVQQYTEHEDLITCVSLFPPNHNIFMSGSRDCTVRVWDRRRERCVGMFGTAKNGRLQAHDAMITCLDAIDTNFILSAGMDTRVLRWDFRTLASQGGSAPIVSLQLDDSAVLKVALGGRPSCAAVSTLRGLYLADFSNARPTARMAEPFKDNRRIGRYHDLKWANGRNLLYAAGDDTRIDVYTLR